MSAEYRLFQIAGLDRSRPDYYSNLQRIVRQLSYQLKAPITTHDVDGQTFLVIPLGFGDPPDILQLVGTVATLKETGDVLDLDFTDDRPELDPVRLRFLQFIFQGPLWKDMRLWQPGAGKPFFFKKPAKQFGQLELYEGFAARVTRHPESGFGLVVDLRRKLVSRSSLPIDITREQINALKGRSCVYKMGRNWYEVNLSGLADLTVGEPSIQLQGKPVSLIDYLHTNSPKPVPGSIANLCPDGAAIYYRTNGPQQRSAPAALCYLVEDTHGREGAKYHRETVIDPRERRGQINRLVGMFLQSVQVGNIVLSVSTQAGRVKSKPFSPPALRYGNNVTLSVDARESSVVSAVRKYGQLRLKLLEDANAGFYVHSPLDRQYFVVPKSIANSSGSQFLKDLKARTATLYPNGGGYHPEVIVYDDLNCRRDFIGQSRAIQEAMEADSVVPGYALVMVHRYDRRPRSADQLAAWTAKEFTRQFDLNAAVIHTDVIRSAYASVTRDGETRYVVKESQKKRFYGYLRNVALNKILLTNGKWPFVLENPLHADIVIGIDVKNSTAAFTLITDGGRVIRFAMSPSRQKEQLLKNQVATFVADLIRKEAPFFSHPPKRIVVHRDGNVWPIEINGLQQACECLAEEGRLDKNWQLTVVEIKKTAPAPVRLFDVKSGKNGQGLHVENPIIGSWLQTAPDEGYVCTTGNPFKIPGTSNPLHIRRASGKMSVEHCLSDVFSLSCLTWTRPEGSMRLPISIKLCDRSLFDEAAEYDEDAIAFGNDNFKEAAT